MRSWKPIEVEVDGKIIKESNKAFHAFELFRDLGPDRTLAKAASLYYGNEQYAQGIKQVPGQMRLWSARFEWFDRASAHDARDRIVAREAVEEHLRTRAYTHEERRAKLREMILENGEIAASKEREMLDSPLYQTTERIAEGDNGDEVRIVIHNPAKWNFNTIARLHAVAMTSAGDVPELGVRNVDLSKATDHQLERIANGEDPITVMQDTDEPEDGATLDLE